MDIRAEKLSLIEWIAGIEDAKVLKKLIEFRKTEQKDCWNELSDFEKMEIEAGLKDIEAGNTTEHAEVKKLYEKYL